MMVFPPIRNNSDPPYSDLAYSDPSNTKCKPLRHHYSTERARNKRGCLALNRQAPSTWSPAKKWGRFAKPSEHHKSAHSGEIARGMG